MKIFDGQLNADGYKGGGPDLKSLIKILDDNKVNKAVTFCIPHRQKIISVKKPKNVYYKQIPDPIIHDYSGDWKLAHQYYNRLNLQERQRLYLLSSGFDPMCANTFEDIEYLFKSYPKTFVGLGEIPLFKGGVSHKIETKVNLKSKILDELLIWSGKKELPVLIHCDYDKPNNESDNIQQAYDLLNLFKRNKETTIIYAHLGLDWDVSPKINHIDLMEKFLIECPNLYLNISWEVAAKHLEPFFPSLAKLIKKYPTRIMFGSDYRMEVGNEHTYSNCFNLYNNLFKLLDSKPLNNLLYKNCFTVFENARNNSIRLYKEKLISI